MSDIRDRYIEQLEAQRAGRRNTGILWFVVGVLACLTIHAVETHAQVDLRPLSEKLRDPRPKVEQRSSTASFYERQERERQERRDRYNEQAPTIIREIGDGVTLIQKGYKQTTCWNLGGTLICE